MTISDQARAKVQAFLADVAAHTEGMPPSQQQDLLRQLESHIYEALQARKGDSTAQVADVEAVFSEMDSPESYDKSTDKTLSRLSQSKWALLISLGGLLIAGILVAMARGQMAVWIPFFLFLGAQITAFVLGIPSWRDPFGKAAVFTSAALTLISLLCV